MTTSKQAQSEAQNIVAETDTGARVLGGNLGKFVAVLCFTWSAFQIYTASSLPFTLTEWSRALVGGTGIRMYFGNTEIRFIHLAFALTLAALAFPLFKRSPRNSVPWYDWVLIAFGLISTGYLLLIQNEIAGRAGLFNNTDITISLIGMGVLALAVYRSLGLPLVIVAAIFVFYVFFGDRSFMPDAIQWKGASVGKATWHFWMQLEGVFGVALGVSAGLIYLFVLFGSLLEKAGAGNYFIKLAFALLGHLRGGPAKAAVVASAASGLYSGSSIANVVTTGTFTIPLMKKTGFSAEKAGAVEVASSTNGQLTPPVMGAAAFLIAEFTGVPYQDILRHAFLPAVVSYIALVYIVHLEALKMDLKGLPKLTPAGTFATRLANFLIGFIGMGVLSVAVFYGLGWINSAFPSLGFPAAIVVCLAIYFALIVVAARMPDLVVDDPDAPIEILPRAWDVCKTGMYYVLPIVILIWCILIIRLSPSFSALWATIAMIVIVLTQDILKNFLRNVGDYQTALRKGWDDFVAGMIAGARNMISIAVATGAAGVIIGTISLTGAHQVISEFVEVLSGGSLMLMLILVAIMSLLLGMGLPTTANYIVVSSLMAPVIMSVGAQQGLIVPLVAVHMFVFYFGILADDTPPVGLAAFAAAAISGGDPIKTGIQGFMYDIRTALLPFLFIFNTELLLIDVTLVKAVIVFAVSVVAMMLFAAATQGYFFAKSRWWESLALLVIALTLFRPGYWLDQFSPKYDYRPGGEIIEIAANTPENGRIRFFVRGSDFDDPDKVSQLTVEKTLKTSGSGLERLKAIGLVVTESGGKFLLEQPLPSSTLQSNFQMFDFYGDVPIELIHVEVRTERIAKEIFYIPALFLLGFVIMMQRRRQTKPAF
jgi:TRAP transporter 4TM/12TM fusion protein